MSVIRTVVGRPTTFLIIFILLAVLGGYATSKISVDFLPEIENPEITVNTTLTGASPQEIEDSITKIIEGAVSNLKNVEKITSNIETGVTSTVITFAYGTDLDAATADLRNNLGLVESALPTDSNTQILQLNTANIPVLVLQLTGQRGVAEIFQLADDVVRPRLERLEGVARVSVFGSADPVLRIEVPQERLDAYNLNLNSMANTLRQNNARVLGGQITDGGLEYLVESSGSFKDVAMVRNAVVAYRGKAGSGQQIIRTRDVANVFLDYEEDGSTAVFVDGEPSIYIVIQKQSQANTVKTSANVLSELPRVQQNLPSDMIFNTVFDTSEFIRNSLNSTSQNALWGVVLAVLILYIFLRSVRATLVISIAIPISVVITLMMMYFMNLSLNLMTLSGLALGVGMLVDNSIVILENIYRYRNRGVKLISSTILGSKEMITPIMSSTLTTICVFLPLALLQNELETVGQLFTALALTVVIALCASLVVAIFLVPVLASYYLKLQPSVSVVQKKGFFPAINRAIERLLLGIERMYKSTLGFMVRHRYLSFLFLIIVLVVGVVFVPKTGFEAFPRFDEDRVTLDITLPVGTQEETTRSILFELESYVKENYPDAIESTSVEIGQSVRGPGASIKKNNIGSLSVQLPDFAIRPIDSEEMQQILREKVLNFPSVELQFSQGGGDLQEGAPITLTLRGNDYDVLRSTGEEILNVMREMEGLAEPRLNLPEPMPQINVTIDRQRAYTLGISINAIGNEIKAALSGVSAGKVDISGTEYSIVISLPERNRDQLPDLSRLFVITSAGQKISLDNLARFEKGTAPNVIKREDQSRYLRVNADIAPDFTSDVLVPELQRQVLQNVVMNEAVTIEYGGSYQDFMRNVRIFAVFGIFAILLVYGIMASLFESFLDPFIILFTIPLTFVGVLLVYAIGSTPLNSFTMVGFIMLFGIVVNNGIVLVDYTNLLRRRGMDIFEACAVAGRDRLRPILMTTLTTVFGMVPIAFISTEGSELVQPIAKTVVGGLSVGSFLTLFFMPVLYAIFNIWSERLKNWKHLRQKRKEDKILEVKHAK